MQENTPTTQEPHYLPPRRDSKGRFALFALVLFLAGMFFMKSRPAPTPVGWSDDFPTATKRAASLGQDLLVAFHSSTCPPCRAMDRDVLSNAKLQSRLKNVVAVRVDAFEQADLARAFGIYATPTYAVLDSAGGVLGVTGGYQSVEEFIRFLDQAQGRSRPLRTQEAADPTTVP
ncbi:MAG: thioredoxin family protein [Phycisphaerae bacterium]